jgi:hypothetical protein
VILHRARRQDLTAVETLSEAELKSAHGPMVAQAYIPPWRHAARDPGATPPGFRLVFQNAISSAIASMPALAQASSA